MIPEKRTEALKLVEMFKVEVNAFADEFYNNTPESKLASEHLAEVVFGIDKLRTLIESDEPKSEPSKSLDEVVIHLSAYFMDKLSAVYPGIPCSKKVISEIKRILVKSGLVVPIELKSRCCNANLRLLKGFDYREAFRKIEPIKLQCIDCDAIDMVTLTPTAITAIERTGKCGSVLNVDSN